LPFRPRCIPDHCKRFIAALTISAVKAEGGALATRCAPDVIWVRDVDEAFDVVLMPQRLRAGLGAQAGG
jgi:hypothetical protein